MQTLRQWFRKGTCYHQNYFCLSMPYHLFLWLRLSLFCSAGSTTETAPTSRPRKASITSTFSSECAGEEAPSSGAVMASFLCRFLGRTSLVHKEILNLLEVDCSSPWKLDLLSTPNKILSFKVALLSPPQI